MPKDFENQWQNKLKKAIEIEKSDFSYHDFTLSHLNNKEYDWTNKLFNELHQHMKEAQIKNVFTACACQYPKENLAKLKEEFENTNDLEYVHSLLQKMFESYIREYKQLNDEQMDFLRENGWGMAGRLEKDTITAIKIPKDFNEYFHESDSLKKKFHYCHCPRIRELFLKNDDPVDPLYCYCGAGFYKGIWEFILGRKVRIDVKESIMKGDEFCRIAIHLNE